MQTDPRTIDLGVVNLGPDHAPGEPDLPEQSTPEPAAAGGAARRQHWWPLLALTAVLVGSTSAADPVADPLVPLFEVAASHTTAVTVFEQTLYVATGRPAGLGVTDPEWTLHAYQLPGGIPLWSTVHDVPQRQGAIDIQVVDGYPLVTSWTFRQPSTGRPPVRINPETTGYDAGTGAERWTHPGFSTAGAAGGEVVLDAPRYEANPPSLTSYLTSTVDLATGTTRWTRQLSVRAEPHARQRVVWAITDDGQHLAVLTRAGRLTVHDLATGERQSVQLGHRWHDASLAATGDTLRVSTLLERERTLAVYDLDPLAERWILTGQSPTTSLAPCGPVICKHRGDEVTGLDPDTGTVQWQADGEWFSPAPLAAPWPDHLLQVRQPREDDTRGAAPQRLVVDAVTGQQQLALGQWLPLEPGQQNHPRPIVYQRGESTHPPGHPDHDPGRLWLGRVTPNVAGIQVLGSFDGAHSCYVGEQYVACVTTDQRVEVWRLR